MAGQSVFQTAQRERERERDRERQRDRETETETETERDRDRDRDRDRQKARVKTVVNTTIPWCLSNIKRCSFKTSNLSYSLRTDSAAMTIWAASDSVSGDSGFTGLCASVSESAIVVLIKVVGSDEWKVNFPDRKLYLYIFLKGENRGILYDCPILVLGKLWGPATYLDATLLLKDACCLAILSKRYLLL